jgi:hypothetical protein
LRPAKEDRQASIQALYERVKPTATFISLDVDPQNPKTRGATSTGVRFGKNVSEAGLGAKVVENSVKTMLAAEQFEYLRLAGLPNAEWAILVELHYVRSRPKDMAGFHKDTHGQSLFVNLNYHVPRKVRGPEYVLNPPSSQQHDELIYGTPETEGTLPKEFTRDLTETRQALGEPKRIESAGTVQPYGYVAFVDEAIHHATPYFGHRYVTPAEFKAYLERKHKAKFDEIIYRESHPWLWAGWTKAGYKSYIADDEVAKWKEWLTMASVDEGEKKRYARQDFAKTMQGDEFDRMLEDVGSQDKAARESGGAGGWHSASIPKGAPLSPVKPKERPPLVRTASDADLTKKWPRQLPEGMNRRFIRTWVRAVPRKFADDVRAGSR